MSDFYVDFDSAIYEIWVRLKDNSVKETKTLII